MMLQMRCQDAKDNRHQSKGESVHEEEREKKPEEAAARLLQPPLCVQV